jgi:hypothetical protein
MPRNVPFSLFKGNITLPQFGFQAMRGKFPLAPGAGKETAFIFQELEVQDKSAFQFGFGEAHDRSDHLQFRDGDNKLTAPLPVFGLLLQDFGGEIPG